MKVTHFILAASTMLAMVFAISCSSDDDESGSSNIDMSGLPTQLYVNNEKYNNDGDIKIIFEKWDDNYLNMLFSDTLSAGNIQNGKVMLNLPENINSKYLKDMGDPCDNYKSCNKNNLFYTKDWAFANAQFHVIIPGKYCYYLRLYSTEVEAGFTYFSKPGKMEGTLRYTEEREEGDRNITATYNVNVLKGWDILWTTIDWGENSINASVSTNPTQVLKNSVKWQASCRDVD
jgi:hypothetical protein